MPGARTPIPSICDAIDCRCFNSLRPRLLSFFECPFLSYSPCNLCGHAQRIIFMLALQTLTLGLCKRLRSRLSLSFALNLLLSILGFSLCLSFCAFRLLRYECRACRGIHLVALLHNDALCELQVAFEVILAALSVFGQPKMHRLFRPTAVGGRLLKNADVVLGNACASVFVHAPGACLH